MSHQQQQHVATHWTLPVRSSSLSYRILTTSKLFWLLMLQTQGGVSRQGTCVSGAGLPVHKAKPVHVHRVLSWEDGVLVLTRRVHQLQVVLLSLDASLLGQSCAQLAVSGQGSNTPRAATHCFRWLDRKSQSSCPPRTVQSASTFLPTAA